MDSSVPLLVLAYLIVGISSQQPNSACFPPPNQKDAKECCAVPHVAPTREVFASCMQKFPLPAVMPTPGSPPPGASCLAECLLEQLGIMTNGIISKDAAKSRLTSMVGSAADWQAVAQSTVDTCYSQTSSLGGQKDSMGCSTIAGAFFDCLPTTMFMNCPAASWTSNTECDQQKNHLKKGCSIMTLMKGPPPMM